jgi:hypothetical protein
MVLDKVAAWRPDSVRACASREKWQSQQVQQFGVFEGVARKCCEILRIDADEGGTCPRIEFFVDGPVDELVQTVPVTAFDRGLGYAQNPVPSMCLGVAVACVQR